MGTWWCCHCSWRVPRCLRGSSVFMRLGAVCAIHSENRLHRSGEIRVLLRHCQVSASSYPAAADLYLCRRKAQPPAHVGFSLANSSTLKMEATLSSKTSVHTISTRRHIPEDDNLHSHLLENLKSIFSSQLDICNPFLAGSHVSVQQLLYQLHVDSVSTDAASPPQSPQPERPFSRFGVPFNAANESSLLESL
jgi:hypothetical protein